MITMSKTNYMLVAAVLLLTLPAKSQAQGCITFLVDEDLAQIEDGHYSFFTGEKMAATILDAENIRKESQQIIATSFTDAQCLVNPGQDAFFRCMVEAYSRHKSITLSPDMIWLLVCQGFSRYINAHADELRPELVSHTGKMDLVVESQQDLFSADVDWTTLFDGFSSQIDRYTNGDIAKIITSDFSTTSQVELIASQITLMESVRSYFEYIVYNMACGIPSITLKGTPDDWRHVLYKTNQLKRYGLDHWTESLEPILTEFIHSAEGCPNQKFWQSMIKRQQVNKLKGGACSPDKPTEIDGWVLKFFPDENGETLDFVPHSKNMPSEYARVGIKYRVLDPVQGTVISEIPMELWAGFIGTEVDTITNTFTPKVGWLVRKAQTDEDILNELRTQNDEYGIELRVKELPDVFLRMEHIKRLRLIFTDGVVLPDWFFNLSIDELTIEGKTSDDIKNRILKHFPKAKVKS